MRERLEGVSARFICAAIVAGLVSDTTAQLDCLLVGEPRTISNSIDVDHLGIPDPGQTLWIDCFGGSILGTDFDKGDRGLQIDALAKTGFSVDTQDAFFRNVIDNEVPLLISVTGDPNIYFEMPGGRRDLWLPGAARDDVDGMEFWGDSIEDSYSEVGDPGGVSLVVTDRQGANPGVITQSQILQGIQSLGVGLDLRPEDIDVDATMSGLSGVSEDLLMFSVVPAGDLDGGEVFVLDMTTMTAEFLSHGGHLWNTEFNVMAAFGVLNENINGLEALPAPGTLSLLGLAVMARGRRRRLPRRG